MRDPISRSSSGSTESSVRTRSTPYLRSSTFMPRCCPPIAGRIRCSGGRRDGGWRVDTPHRCGDRHRCGRESVRCPDRTLVRQACSPRRLLEVGDPAPGRPLDRFPEVPLVTTPASAPSYNSLPTAADRAAPCDGPALGVLNRSRAVGWTSPLTIVVPRRAWERREGAICVTDGTSDSVTIALRPRIGYGRRRPGCPRQGSPHRRRRRGDVMQPRGGVLPARRAHRMRSVAGSERPDHTSRADRMRNESDRSRPVGGNPIGDYRLDTKMLIPDPKSPRNSTSHPRLFTPLWNVTASTSPNHPGSTSETRATPHPTRNCCADCGKPKKTSSALHATSTCPSTRPLSGLLTSAPFSTTRPSSPNGIFN
jgi:hypothetical protein